MLHELEIRNFALIHHLRVPFSAGLNVLTGETGAGKSIIIDALNVVLGGKVGAGIIRNGSERASVEASFSLTPELSAWLKQNELTDDEFDTLVVSREISKSGSKARINGITIGVSVVQELRQKLVTIHAQHEARTLQSSQAQLEMIDALGDEPQKKLSQKVRTLYAQKRDIAARLAEINISEDERVRRLDFARFQLAELQEANLEESDEDEKIANHVKALSNVVELENATSRVQELLSDGDSDSVPGAIDLVQRAVGELTRAAQMDGTLQSAADALNGCLEELEGHARAIRKYRDKLDTDPETLSSLEARLTQLAAIKRKYGPTLAEAIERWSSVEDEVAALENSQAAGEELQREHDEITAELQKIAEQLSVKRKALAARVSERILTELADLGMPHCRFEISFEPIECVATGIDRVEFQMAPNPGQPLLPVGKIASGGELSRVMLAVKSIFADADSVSTVVFDEIETGLSGKVLQAMRDKLAKLAGSHQILCITHQPLIATVADNHVEVSKHQTAEDTKVSASVLNHDERLKAVAAIASGQENQSEAIKFVEALFADSAKLRATLKSGTAQGAGRA
jgi:DNA repair protein RecN (Recombination protein N)